MKKDPPEVPVREASAVRPWPVPWLLFAVLMLVCLAWMRHYDRVQAEHEWQQQALARIMSQRKVAQALPDFKALPMGERKTYFLAFVDVLIRGVNAHLVQRRAFVQAQLLRVANGLVPREDELAALRALLKHFRLDDRDTSEAQLRRLLRRVDIVPPSLALAQAANESAWGTSRFAREGNNLFGQWCYTPGCGLVPMRRELGGRHEVKRFDWPYDSVASYVHNLNTHPAYRGFRQTRESLQDESQTLSGLALLDGLRSYSERGPEYLTAIRNIIVKNDLQSRDVRNFSFPEASDLSVRR